MITLPELLRDKRFKEFFCQVPKEKSDKANWRLYVQRKSGGGWARKDYENYAEAFQRLKVEFKRGTLYDGAIQSRGFAYAPPQRVVAVTRGGQPVYQIRANGEKIQKTAVVVWKPKLPADEETHTWCTYCRRPTVFRWFSKPHHALRGTAMEGLINPEDRRCAICGAREEFIRSTSATALLPGHSLTPKPTKRRRR